MGKGRIISGGSQGEYVVAIVHDRTAIEAELAQLAIEIAALGTAVTERETALSDAQTAADAANAALDAAIEYRDVDGNIDLKLIIARTAEAIEASNAVQIARIRLAEYEGRLSAAQARQAELNALPDEPQQSAWCADFSESLSGEVATAEVPGEPADVIIRPGFDDDAAFSASRDGQLVQRAGMDPNQVYFNAAILPGWQKFMPTYRVGELTSIGATTGTVLLDAAISSADGLSIDPPDGRTLTNVPIDYMDCDAAAFQVGDRVLVEFTSQDPTQPKVIGFESEPRPCVVKHFALCGANVYGYESDGTDSGPYNMTAPNGYGLAIAGDRIFIVNGISGPSIYENSFSAGYVGVFATPTFIGPANDVATDGESLYVAGSITVGGSEYWGVAKYDLTTGVKLWELAVNLYLYGGAITIAANSSGFMCADNGECYTFDGDGTKTSGNLNSSLGMVERTLFEWAVAASRDRFYVLDRDSVAESGSVRIFQFANGGGSSQVVTVTSSDVPNANVLISASEDYVCLWPDWQELAVPEVPPQVVFLPRTVVRDDDGDITSDTIATTGTAYELPENSYIGKACINAATF